MGRQFAALCRVLDLDGIATDPPFATNEARVANRASLTALITERTSRRLKAELIAALEDAGVLAGRSTLSPRPSKICRPRPEDFTLPLKELPGVGTPIALSRSGLQLGKGGPPPRRWRLAFPHIEVNGGKHMTAAEFIDVLGRVKG